MAARALVVDDSRAMRRILTRMLSELGFETEEAAGAKEALAILRSRAPLPDLALVDWNMPEMSGIEFVRTVRADPDCNDVSLLMVTTETEPARVAEALAAGADEYVMKPFTQEVLVSKLAILGMKV